MNKPYTAELAEHGLTSADLEPTDEDCTADLEPVPLVEIPGTPEWLALHPEDQQWFAGTE